jgi:hypothetical protein
VEPTSGEIPRLFYFKKSRNHLNEVQNFRDVLFLEKKGPCQECTTQKSGVGILTRIQISRYPDIQISRYPDIQIYPAPMSGHRSSETQKHRNTDPDDTSRAGNTETQKHSTAYRGPKHGNTKHKTETRKH